MPSVTLKGRAIKVSIVLDAAGLAGVKVRGEDRFSISVEAGGYSLVADLSAKSMRKNCAVIAANGADGVLLLFQGKLVGNKIEEAGLAATPRQPSSAPAERSSG